MKRCLIHETDIRQMVSECISRIISEQRKKVGKYTIVDGDYIERDLRHLGKGACYDVRMYDEQGASPYNTICLFQRRDNGKYLYTKLVDDEQKKGYTKFALMPLCDVPQEIRADFQNLPQIPPYAQEEILWHKMGCPFPYL